MNNAKCRKYDLKDENAKENCLNCHNWLGQKCKHHNELIELHKKEA